MKALFSIVALLLFFVTTAFSQNIQFVHDEIVTGEGSACDAFYAMSGVINNTGAEQIIAWERLENNMPCDWFNSVCDINICYAPFLDNFEFQLADGDTMYLSVSFYAVNQEATGSVVMRAYVKDDPTIADTLIYEASSTPCENSEACVSSISTAEVLSENMYPNPVSSILYIDQMRAKGFVSLYSTRGQKVFHLNDFQNGSIDLSHFYKGTYLVVVNDGLTNHHQIIVKE